MLKHSWYLSLFIAIMLLGASSFAQYPAQVNTTFDRGEELKFAVYFHSLLTGNIRAGVFEMKVTGENKSINGRSTYHYIATGKGSGAFSVFYKINDRFESYADEASLLPLLSMRRINENDYIRNQDHIFDHKNKQILYKDNLKGISRTISSASNVHDILSVVYSLRNAAASNDGTVDSYQVSYVFNDSIYSSHVKIAGIETVQTSIGKVSCIKVQPQVLTGKVFSTSYPLTLWISNDANHIPILIESEIILGSIRLELIFWSGLKNPFSALK